MKTYYKNKILINRLFPMIDYKIDGYIEKTGEYDKNIINMKYPDSIFYTSGHLFSSVYSPKEKDKKISTQISKYTSKIQFLPTNECKSMKSKIINYYDIRSSYIHGNEPISITDENEFDLREIVRKVLIIYWYISLDYRINSSEEMEQFLDKNTTSKLPPNTKSFIRDIFKL